MGEALEKSWKPVGGAKKSMFCMLWLGFRILYVELLEASEGIGREAAVMATTKHASAVQHISFYNCQSFAARTAVAKSFE